MSPLATRKQIGDKALWRYVWIGSLFDAFIVAGDTERPRGRLINAA